MNNSDLNIASIATLQQERAYLEVVRNKKYLNVDDDDVSFRMSEFWGIVPAGEYDAYILLDRVREIISRFEKIGILKNLDFGEPAMQHTIFSCTIDAKKLSDYISDVENEIELRKNPKPKIDEAGVLQFRGESISFTGYERKFLQFLLDRSGTIVSKEELFEKVYGKDYIAEVGKFKKVGALEPLEAVYKEVKKKILANPLMKKTLVIVQQEGFGLFVNK